MAHMFFDHFSLGEARDELDLQRDRDALLADFDGPKGGSVCRSICALFGRR